MKQNLKCVIFGDRHVIQDDDYLPEIEKLIQFLINKNIKVLILSNDDDTEKDHRILLRDKLRQKYQQIDWYIADRNETIHKPKAEAVLSPLKQRDITASETIYIGNSDTDMKTAVNSKILFLNATWYGQQTDYGFQLETPQEIARFIDIFCLREHLWAYEIKDGDLEYYALGIYGTREEKYDYSHDARETAKFGRGHPDFWIKYLLSAVYFSGLHERIDYIAPYPGHEQGSTSVIEKDTIITFAKCFRKSYLSDLIERHTTSNKSAYARYNQQSLDHLNQLNTIKLNKYPINQKVGKPYTNCPLKKDKTVLVIDDFCTQGYSLETSRIYIQKTGAKVILLSLLKTICKDYERIIQIEDFLPFQNNHLNNSIQTKKYSFSKYLTDNNAHQEIRAKLKEYDNWNW
ncbi:HAD hydrolase-like protein [Cyanobacterium aponinum AL20118]|uniref:HAD hydrolase-like protein n=1 Tax=Cyanobacterium aponinum AL20115 TaxID=3090662 RepID=A0AAF0ZBR5_9CHRO|nr:HAD hydrolase-like protein [Cyanobacterium aponinum]WPF87388.1 HAD hydrolase-like protein [Cyanobacterium aponinum AL20115]